jgi:signal transduction histidine kinase
LHPELDKKKISVHDNLNGRSLKLKADPQLLYRSFLNIFVNAIQSIKDGGTITVEVEEEKDRYVVGIEDTGSGIREENLNKIFNPFFSTKEEGSGLGLSIVRNIMEAHGGSITIESKVDSGTKVTITLPRG